ncbi:hypothetical protein [Staphylococcus epidermidis]|uniref:hypothetical protein n=1 Tax=Staphylococcus epidermidis TaxID=1282 RepID=UPI0034E24A8A
MGITRAVKYGSNVMGDIGFGTGVYSDIKQGHKTSGEVVTHNGLTLGTVATAIVVLTIEALGLNSKYGLF